MIDIITDAKPVLVAGSDHRVAVAIARCLNSHGIPVDVAFQSGMHTGSRAIRKIHQLPSLQYSDAVAFSISHLVDQEGYDMVIPCNDLILASFQKHYDELRQRTYLACPPPQILSKVLDKTITLAVAQKLAINIPKTASKETHTLDEILGTWKFPLIAKPKGKFSRFTAKVLYFKTAEILRVALDNNPNLFDEVIFQEYCPGIGVGIETFFHRGKALYLFQHQRLQEFPITGGVSVMAQAVPLNPDLVEQSVKLLQDLEWQGVAMVEFRYDPKENRSVLMEINGRYWGSLALSYESQVEFPWYEWQIAHGREPKDNAGPVCLNSQSRFYKWIEPSLVMPPLSVAVR